MADFSHVIDNIINTEIKESPLNGYGLFATNKIMKDQVLCILDGQYLNYSFVKKVMEKLENNEEAQNAVKFKELEWNQINNDLLLVRNYPTKYRFINHYRIPNLRILKNPLRVIALEDINIGEELLLDYREEELGDEYLLDHGLTYL